MRTVLKPIYVVKQYERGIVEFFGQYRRFVEPGLESQNIQRTFYNIDN